MRKGQKDQNNKTNKKAIQMINQCSKCICLVYKFKLTNQDKFQVKSLKIWVLLMKLKHFQTQMWKNLYLTILYFWTKWTNMMRTKMTFKNILIKKDKSKVHLQNLRYKNSRMTMQNSNK
jgi:hypothetical protein